MAALPTIPDPSPPRDNDSPGSGFFRLPPEIRAQIYEHLVVIPRAANDLIPTIYMLQTSFQIDQNFSPSRIPEVCDALSLFQTCRLFYMETTVIFFSRHRFDIPRSVPKTMVRMLPVLKHFLFTIGPVNAGFIRHLTLPFPVEVNHYETVQGTWDYRWPEHTHQEMLSLLVRSCPDLETIRWDTTMAYMFHAATDYVTHIITPSQRRYLQGVIRTIDTDYRTSVTNLQRILWVDFLPALLARTAPTPCNCCLLFTNLGMQLGWIATNSIYSERPIVPLAENQWDEMSRGRRHRREIKTIWYLMVFTLIWMKWRR